MYYLVGLGNPGVEYEKTRHNVGFLALDFIINEFSLSAPANRSWCSGRVTEGLLGNEEVTLLYPETFMNNSGVAVKKLVKPNEVQSLVVLYDDTALPIGAVKVSFGRGDGGHNGIKSIVSALGTKDFIRVRIGVAPKAFLTGKTKLIAGADLSKFVLQKFSKGEEKALNVEVLPKVANILATIVEAGYVKAMNEYN
jgi:PTH1 family peptidyl-tRNA hydrolase